ncbi:hypothetical protein CPC08DRAFT_452812 [Agrocybe pediades]|nr:hypothetical protein CPC08DRAFT_452812 [Agrocybe pediades]
MNVASRPDSSSFRPCDKAWHWYRFLPGSRDPWLQSYSLESRTTGSLNAMKASIQKAGWLHQSLIKAMILTLYTGFVFFRLEMSSSKQISANSHPDPSLPVHTDRSWA